MLTAVVVLVPAGAATWVRLNQQSQTIGSVFRQPVTRLDVSADAGEIAVSPGPAGRVTMSGTLTWSLYKPRVHTSWSGSTLTVALTCAPQEPGLVVSVFGSDCGGDRIDLQVPPGVSVVGDSASGELDVRGMDGGLRLSAGSGSVVMTGDAGAIWASVNSGLITGTGLTSAMVKAVLSSGRVVLQFTGDPRAVAARVDSGSASITVPSGARYRITGHTGSGSWSIAPGLADRSAHGSISLTVGSGSASVGYPGSG